ncbi:hypothetical protein A1F99_120520 [Pyrenophora tritici-repentis]|nr:hypothetical protein A1F99_120520 [Pyrenophora tritici-repentis]
MDNLMHNTLEEIATHVRTIELPTPAQQPETESFYEDSPPEESLAQDSEGDQPGYYQGRKIRDSYPTPPATPPPAALLARLMAGASLDEKDRQGTPKTAPWAAAFMAGTQAGKVGEYRGVAMDKAAILTDHAARATLIAHLTAAQQKLRKKLDAALAADNNLRDKINKALDKWRAKQQESGGSIAIDDGNRPTRPTANTVRYIIQD